MSDSHEPAIKSMVLPYAHRVLKADRYAQDLGDHKDFPNFALKRYLRSLSKYIIESKVYSLESKKISVLEDPTGLAESGIVFFGLQEKKTGHSLAFSDVGSALGYVFPILCGLGEHGCLAIEQPELHLHPLAQDELTDAIIHAANRKTDFPRRIIVESHSEVFLLRLAARIKQAHDIDLAAKANVTEHTPDLRVSSDRVKIYYFQPRLDGVCDVEEIRFSPDGALIESWPSGMFSNDWTSGISRLKLFSGSFGEEQAKNVWTWIERVGDADVRKWLSQAALLDAFEGAALDSETILWAKVAEKLLLEILLLPVLESVDFSKIYAERHRRLVQELKDFESLRARYLGLGWWIKTLVGLKAQPTKLDPHVFQCLRRHIDSMELQKILADQPEGSLISLLKDLQDVRNPAAHTGQPDPETANRAKRLIVIDGSPGLLFSYFDVLKLSGPSGQLSLVADRNPGDDLPQCS